MFFNTIVNYFITFDKSSIGIMQFSNPEILYLLFLLIIPILIHLFQLQKFEKVAFTNVRLLKQIEQQTRKSSKLKKLLILISRLLLFTCLILAFAQPDLSKKDDIAKTETIIYLDNSLSMQAKGDHGELLQKAKHDLIESFDNSENPISLITNNGVYLNLQAKDLKNELLNIKYYPIKKDLKTVLLQINGLRSTYKNKPFNVVLISDFQNFNTDFQNLILDSLTNYSLVQTLPVKAENIVIDSLWISNQNTETIKIKSKIISQESVYKNLSISLYLNDQLYGKSTISLDKNESKEIEFSFPNTGKIQGKFSFADHWLEFDNNFYFNINPIEKSKVLSIGENHNFLAKIYTEDEFIFTTSSLNQLDYSLLSSQNLIILNELVSIPNSLLDVLKNYMINEGNLVVIPSKNSDIISYNKLLSALNIGKIIESTDSKKSVITINYNHPFFKDVFRENIDNFQYPTVNMSFTSILDRSTPILQFNDQSNFISETKINNGKFYWIASPLERTISNFVSSPLVVPVFYNFGKQNRIQQNLYYTIGIKNEIIVKSTNSEDDVLHLTNDQYDFIPLQTKTTNHIKLQTESNPLLDGIYQITNNDTHEHLAFNYNRKESNLDYHPIEQYVKNHKNAVYYSSVENAITLINDQYKKHTLWQLFVIFALIFLGIEILLQKFIKFSN